MAWLSLMAVLSAGCGGESEEAPAPPAPPPPVEVKFGPTLGLETEVLTLPGPGHPRLYVEGVSFVDEVATPEPVDLDGDYVLEFVPFVDEQRKAPASIRTYLSVAGGEEQLLSTDPAEPWRARKRRKPDRIASVSQPVEIDLAPYRGQRVTLRWELGEGEKSLQGLLTRPRLRRVEPAAPRRPDVLLVCSDTHRYDFASGDRAETLMPALERLQTESVVYRQGFSNASWTMPSIASTLTGLFPRYHRSGQVAGIVEAEGYDVADVPPGLFAFRLGAQYRLLSTYSDQLRSLPEYLRDMGYTTVIVASNPLYFLSGLAFDGSDLAINIGVAKGEVVTATALEALRHVPADRPLFLLVHYMDVHHWEPWYFTPGHPGRDRNQSREQVVESYTQAVRDTDRHLESLLSSWSDARPWDGTLAAFYADHGEHLLDPSRPTVLGHGNTMDDLLLHVPLLVKYPSSSGVAPTAVDDPVSLADLTPTILAALDVPHDPAGFSGRSLLAAAADSEDGERELFADYQLFGEDLASVRRGPYKLVLNFDRGENELVDLRSGEVLAERSGETERLRRELMRAFLDYRERAEAETANLAVHRSIDQEEALEQLQALGYVQ